MILYYYSERMEWTVSLYLLRGTGYFKLILSRHLTWLDPNYLQILKCQSLNFLRPVNFVKTNSFTGEIWREGRVTSRLRALAQQMTERPESWVRHTREDDGALCRAKQTTAGLLDTSGRVAFVVSLHETYNTATSITTNPAIMIDDSQ